MSTTRKLSSVKSTDLAPANDVRTGLTVESIKQSFIDNLLSGLGRMPAVATPHDAYTALALSVRDRVFRRGVTSLEAYDAHDVRAVAYLSAEYLPGR